jgi:hypothetical protein
MFRVVILYRSPVLYVWLPICETKNKNFGTPLVVRFVILKYLSKSVEIQV